MDDKFYLRSGTGGEGPAAERAWRFCDDPAHAWIRGTWASQPVDPRLPLTSAREK